MELKRKPLRAEVHELGTEIIGAAEAKEDYCSSSCVRLC